MAKGCEPALEFIRKCNRKGDKRKDPKLTWKSYLLQEAEATSREAKIRWCVANGKKVFGLQHDGIVVQSGDDASEETAMAAAMEVAATKEAGYSVKIKAERCRNLCVD